MLRSSPSHFKVVLVVVVVVNIVVVVLIVVVVQSRNRANSSFNWAEICSRGGLIGGFV